MRYTSVSRAPAPATPLFWATGGLLAGQAAAGVVADAALPAAGAALAAVCLALAGLGRAARGRWRALPFAPLALALGAAAVGYWQLDGRLRPRFPDDHVVRFAGGRVEIRGQVAGRPSPRATHLRLLVDVAAVRRGQDWQPARGLVSVTVHDAVQPWRWGDAVHGVVALRRPRNFGNPGEFDYEAFLARRGVYATGFAAGDRTWTRHAASAGWLLTRLEAWRDAVARCLDATLEPPARTIVAALLLGEAAALAPEVRDRYARAGVSHVLSISGLHIGLVAATGYAALRWLLARSERLLLRANVPKLALAASFGPVLLYAFIAGTNVATIRAEVMSLLVIAATLLDRPRDWLAGLAAAALGISWWWPGSVFEISFQLSFVAVLALVLGMQRVARWWAAWEEARLVRLRDGHWAWLRWVVLSQAVSVCALLGTAPLTAWHFNQVSLIAPLANAVVVPLLGLAAVSAGLVATVAVACAPPLATVLFWCVGVVVRVADRLVAWCAAVPGASVHLVTPSPVELVLLYGALAAALLRPGRARRALLAACAVLFAADAAGWYAQRHHRRDLEVTFVSVGQGDSAVIAFPGSRVMVIDGGGLSAGFDVGRQVVGPFLWRRKIGRIDTLVLSHADFDHYGGLGFLAQAFRPRRLWWNGGRGRGPRFEEFWQAVTTAGVTPQVVRRGFREVIGGVEVTVLHPEADTRGGTNDRSLTLRLRYGPTVLLFPGDLQSEGERLLVAADGGALASTVLKVPHHGSRTSSTPAFLRAVAPRIAVASVGYDNRFRVPDPSIAAAYERLDCALLRTDRDGAVTLRITREGAIDVITGRPAAARTPAPFARRGGSALDTVAERCLKRGDTEPELDSSSDCGGRWAHRGDGAAGSGRAVSTARSKGGGLWSECSGAGTRGWRPSRPVRCSWRHPGRAGSISTTSRTSRCARESTARPPSGCKGRSPTPSRTPRPANWSRTATSSTPSWTPS